MYTVWSRFCCLYIKLIKFKRNFTNYIKYVNLLKGKKNILHSIIYHVFFFKKCNLFKKIIYTFINKFENYYKKF
jgi:hypothetical protein